MSDMQASQSMATIYRTPVMMSQLYAPTLKEDPGEAELASHKLLLRAGMIRRLAAGIYTYLPLAWRSIQKIETIIREELGAIGSQELLMPAMQPGELWLESGRWDDYGPELMRFTDRHERMFCLGPTHEEVITTLVRNELRSYKQLPVSLYQIQTKYRDEIRPRFGLLRGREFIMKDAYSFHATQESLDETYVAFGHAYAQFCARVGLDFREVEADSGQIGGSETVEFMALADSGEAEIVYCGDYAADAEAAPARAEVTELACDELTKVETPDVNTIEKLAAFFDVPAHATVKAMAVVADEKPYVLFIPGDHELNEIKVERLLGSCELMDEAALSKFGLVKGFIGPVGLKPEVTVVVDESLREVTSWICGANEADMHYKGAKPGRDFKIDEFADLILAQAGDRHPETGEVYESARGIEVAQIFKLGTKYSEALSATFMNEQGQPEPFICGCYGIGVSRALASVIEQHHDERGIVWPISVAPFELSVVPLSVGDDVVYPQALELAKALAARGIEVVIDDRDERAGVKFADNELMGYPYQVVCGKKGIAQGVVELKDRATGEKQEVQLADAIEVIAQTIQRARAQYAFNPQALR